MTTPNKPQRKQKEYKFALVWYSAPKNGGHREILTIDQLKYRHTNIWDLYKKHNIPPSKSIYEVWEFETIDEALAADREEWRTRNIDKRISENEKLFGIQYD